MDNHIITPTTGNSYIIETPNQLADDGKRVEVQQ